MVGEQHFNTRETLPQSTAVSVDFILMEVEDCSGRALKIYLLSGDLFLWVPSGPTSFVLFPILLLLGFLFLAYLLTLLLAVT